MSSCYNCATGFGLFSRAKACNKCGFAFCGKCVKSVDKVLTCAACATKHDTKDNTRPRPRSPPTALQRRLEQLSQPPATLTVYSKEPDKVAKLKRGLSKEDQEIVDRLHKLKSEVKASANLPSESEVADRLAKLKGAQANATSPGAEESKGFYHAVDRRAAPQQADDLMKQMNAEIHLDHEAKKATERVNPVKDIESRLAKLRGMSVEEHERLTQEQQKLRPSSMDSSSSPVDSDSEADALVERMLQEVNLDENLRTGKIGDEDEEMAPPSMSAGVRQMSRQVQRTLSEQEDHEELPWCVICNEDARVRCSDCEGDLYCKRCFKECHSEFEMDHKSEGFAPPKK